MLKKSFLLAALFWNAAAVNAQSLDDISNLFAKKEYTNARAAIDKYMADPKNTAKPEAWYFKGRVYNACSSEKTVASADAFTLKSDAFEAFKKNQVLDAKDTRMKLESYNSYLDLYYGFYDLGANQFNAKDFNGAYQSFSKALEVESYMGSKKYSYPNFNINTLDTPLVMNTAIAAHQAGKKEDAVRHYRMIADANVGGDTYRDVYEYLADYYQKAGNEADYHAILTKGRSLYPTNNFWNHLEIEAVSAKGDKQAVYKKYEELLAADPKNFEMAYNYGVELYNQCYGKEVTGKANPATQAKLETVLTQAIANDPGIEASMLMANHYYNKSADGQDAVISVKGTTPADQKKKADLKAANQKNMDGCIQYSEKVAAYYEARSGQLKSVEKANYKIALGYLGDIYGLKGNPTKAAEYEKKRSAIH